MKIEKVVDAWGGPGDKDSVIVPLKPEENAIYAPKAASTGSGGTSTPAWTTDTWWWASCRRRS